LILASAKDSIYRKWAEEEGVRHRKGRGEGSPVAKRPKKRSKKTWFYNRKWHSEPEREKQGGARDRGTSRGNCLTGGEGGFQELSKVMQGRRKGENGGQKSRGR